MKDKKLKEVFNKHSGAWVSHGETPLMDYEQFKKAVRDLNRKEK